DGARGGQGLARARVAVVVALGEVGGVAGLDRAGRADRRARRRAGRAVISLRVGRGGDRDRPLVDHTVRRADEAVAVVVAAVAVADGARACQWLARSRVAVVVALREVGRVTGLDRAGRADGGRRRGTR